jgi:hypothetical protein
MVERRFEKPDYARYAFEVVRSLILDIWWENSTRWVRIDVLKDLVGNYRPYSVRIFLRGPYETDPWAEPSEYPYWTGDSLDAALQACLDGLADRAEVAAGMESRDNMPPNPPLPRPNPRPRSSD